MGRELRRKEAKKNKVIKKDVELDNNIKGSILIKISIITVILLFVLYYVVAVFITKEINISWTGDNETIDTDVNSIENKILAKNIFNQSEESYYVYFYDFSDEDTNVSGAVDGSDLTVYRVDTGSALNKNYVVDSGSNRNVTSIDNLKVIDNTLVKIEADKVVAYYEGSSEIINFLG